MRPSTAQHQDNAREVEDRFLPTHGLEPIFTTTATATADPNSSLEGASRVELSMTFNVNGTDRPQLIQPLTPGRDDIQAPISPPLSVTWSSNNLDFILNPASAIASPIDSNLQSRSESSRTSFLNNSIASSPLLQGVKPEAEIGHEEAFLLRHFSEAPGKWYESAPAL